MKTSKFVRIVLEIAKYAIGAILGYLEGSENLISSVM